MCGIAGILRFDDEPIDLGRAEAMRDALRHRGPDGDGIAQLGRCTLVHTRLAVIDQHDGAQPMSLPNGSLTVVFNGEVYNHAELRGELEQLGHTFQTDHSDTEVLLHGYRQWGTAMMDRLDGMWAFAIWDAEKQKLLLSRDRAGQKPLFVCRSDANEVAFASTPAALIIGAAHNGAVAAAPDAVLDYLRLGYNTRRSMCGDIAEVNRASWVVPAHAPVQNLQSRLGAYPETHAERENTCPLQLVESTLSQAVSARLVADVALGCFLSAGIDSSLVAALAQQHLRKLDAPPLRTFSVAMKESLYDESAEAAVTARALGTEHTTLQVTTGDLFDDLDTLMRLTGEPTYDSSLLPTYWLCRAAREHVTVALSGDGGDELFGGYDRYRALQIIKSYGGLLRRLPVTTHIEQQSKIARLGRLADAARSGEPASQYLSMVQQFDDGQRSELIPALRHVDTFQRGVPGWHATGDPVRDAMMWDRDNYLPYDILRKVDRASMAVALEVRCPMLSPGMLALSDRLTTDQLRVGGKPKGLLRALAKKYLPASVAKRKKSGFAIPIGRWFRTTLAEEMRERVLDSGYMDRLGLEPGLPERLCAEHLAGDADHTHRLFALLQLSIWHRWLKSQGQ